MNFGGSGFFHHPLLAHLDLTPLLSSALATSHPDLVPGTPPPGAVPGTVGAVVGGVLAGGGSIGSMFTVDQVLVDPCNPTRLGLVMQVSAGGSYVM